ncbi:MAG: hypothetical protein JO269_00755 [Burkholderiaceae bacterium]|nr:hypothetical protein [Burkholderiaceae bacterium]
MKVLAGLLLSVLLAACSTAPLKESQPQSLFDDALFSAPTEQIDPGRIFTVSDEMRHYLDDEIAHKIYPDGKIFALINGLYHDSHLKFSYDATKTLDAADTFHAQAGNCLSLTIMTAAYAKQMHLPVQFHSVLNGEIWDRNQNIDFLIGHVNLTVGAGGHAHAAAPESEAARIIDFVAGENLHNEWMEDIGEDVIVAMYLNNRAAEALTHGDLNNAYWWVRAAIQEAPTYMGAYNTLGVVYMRHQNPAQAELVLQRVLNHEPDNVLALSNQVQVLKTLGRGEEAQVLNRHLRELQPYPPFYFFNRGLTAMHDGDFQAARNEFTKEVNRASYNHQFHFWLALANYYLGNLSETRRQLSIAMENSPNSQQHDLYAAKLAGMTGGSAPR